VRIGPNEVHILDAEFYDVLYAQANNKVDKYSYFYSMLGNPEATFPAIKASTHRLRRNTLNPFFSISAIAKVEPTIQALVNRLAHRMEACAKEDEAIPLFYAYRCLTVDMISEYAFGKQLGLLDRKDWGESFYSAWRSLWEMSPVIRQVPILLKVFEAIPRWALQTLNPRALEILEMQDATNEQMKLVLSENPETYKAREFPTVMWEVARSPLLPPEEKTFQRLAIDGNNILGAGFETTGNVLTLTTYLILDHCDIHQRLLQELEEAIPDSNVIPSWQTLEKLPLLSAVIKESLR
jgi:cytochrome P450